MCRQSRRPDYLTVRIVYGVRTHHESSQLHKLPSSSLVLVICGLRMVCNELVRLPVAKVWGVVLGLRLEGGSFAARLDSCMHPYNARQAQ